MEGSQVLEQEAPDLDVDALTDDELDQQFASALQPDLEGSEPSTDESGDNEEGNPEQKDEKPQLSNEELLKKLDGLEKLQDRRGTELGELRKQNELLLQQLQQAQEKPKEEGDTDFYADPKKATEKTVREQFEAMKRQHQIDVLKAEQQKRQREEVVSKVIPDWKDHIDDTANIMKESFKELPNIDQYIDSFKKNPFNESPENVIAFSLAAKYKKQHDAMKAALEERGLKAADLISKVNKYSGKRLVGNSSTPSKPKVVNISDEDVDNMTDEELEANLKELGIKT